MITIATQCEDRKEMVRKISELLGTPAVYLRASTYAFRIGEITVNRDASITGEREHLMPVVHFLLEGGYVSELPAELEEPDEGSAMAENSQTEIHSEPDTENGSITATTVRIHEPGWELYSMKNLIRILFTRQYLINRMLKMDKLYIDPEVIEIMNDAQLLCVSDLETLVHDEIRVQMIRGFNISGGTVEVEMPCDDGTTTQWMFYSQLITAIVKQAKASRRTKAEKQKPANDKYMANARLNRLGFGGADFKALRHALMTHLNGYAAFKSDDRMQRHKNKLAEQRRVRRETKEEAHSND